MEAVLTGQPSPLVLCKGCAQSPAWHVLLLVRCALAV
jgi:hypothetical protein